MYWLWGFLFGAISMTTVWAKSPTDQRIVALAPHIVENLFAIGAGQQIVATIAYADYPEPAKQIPRVGNYQGLQLESIMALKPDLVIAWRSGTRGEDIARMRQLGLTVVETQPVTLADVSKEIRWLGALTHRESVAERLASRVEQAVQQLREQYRNSPSVSVFYQMWHQPLQTVGPNSWVESLIDLCGGDNIFHQAAGPYPQVGVEQVIQAKPQVMLFPLMDNRVSFAGLTASWAGWKSIPAVRNGKLFPIEGETLHRFTPRVVQGISQLCHAIHR